MNRVKKIFNCFIFTFAFVGVLFGGLMLGGNKKPEQNLSSSSAANITNNLPEYFVPTPAANTDVAEGQGSDHDLFLVGNNGRIDISFTNGEITQPDAQQQKKTNPAYIPDQTPNEDGSYNTYYYFGDFANPIALYYNFTNDELDIGDNNDLSQYTDQNLLQGQIIADELPKTKADKDKYKPGFTRSGEFQIQEHNLLPVTFKMSIGLSVDANADKARATVTSNAPLTNENFDPEKGLAPEFKGSLVTLNKEGVYTLVIPYVCIYTTNNGQRWVYENNIIKYTFMLFKSETYLNHGNQPNISHPGYVQESSLMNNDLYSRYYFYNYDDAPQAPATEPAPQRQTKDSSALPYFSYNPTYYELTVEYIDVDDNRSSYIFALSPDSETLTVTDVVGRPIEDCPIRKDYDKDGSGQATLTFNDLGTYNISFTFVYRSGDNLFYLPITTKMQRLYVFGYQAYYTSAEKDADTNITIPKELKAINKNTGENTNTFSFNKSADITSRVDSILPQRNSVQTQPDNIKEDILKKETDNYTGNLQTLGKPITTNQTPVIFKSNANVVLTAGAYYMVQRSDTAGITSIGNAVTYTGQNLSSPGTYLLILTYQFKDFVSTSGTQQSNYFHYQIFYFTIKNTTPIVTVMNNKGEDIYADGFTNTDVYIVDNSQVEDYDANVDLYLTAEDYVSHSTNFPTKFNFKDFKSGSMYYEHIKYFDKFDTSAPAAAQGKPGLFISAAESNPYRNAHYTIEIYSSSTNLPGTRKFTIDTQEIGKITARTTSQNANDSSTLYIENEVENHMSNQPLIFSWNTKESGAPTECYYRYIPLKETQYYSTESSSSNPNSELLKTFLSHSDYQSIVPVNAMLDITNASSGWKYYSNTNPAYKDSRRIPSSFALSSNGIYIFEVFDKAGNVTFDIFFIDNTSPVFVQLRSSNQNDEMYVLGSTETITVTDQYTYKVLWGRYKGIYINGYDSLSSLATHYPLDMLDNSEGKINEALKAKIDEFFNNNSAQINVSISQTPPDHSIENYSGHYLKIEVFKDALIKSPITENIEDRNQYKQQTTLQADDAKDYANVNVYDIPLFKGEGDEQEANEGAYKFLIRDASNTKYSLPSNPSEDAFKNAPSAYLTINITSDSSRLTFYIEGEGGGLTSLSPTDYSTTGNFYQNGEDKNTLYKNSGEGRQESEDLTYKYTYFAPIRTKRPVFLSYIPHSNYGSILQSLTVEYYPFVRQPETIKGMAYKNGTREETHVYYYTLSQTSTRKTTIFDYEKQGEGIQKDDGTLDPETNIPKAAQRYDLANSNTELAPGKYVFVRTYKLDDNSQIYDYDFYERTLTLIVDRYDIISNTERIDGGVESIVGGDIMISMYTNDGSAEITVSMPDYDENGINQGTLYTTSSERMQDKYDQYPSERLHTNMLPVKVRIPVSKYTTYAQFDNKDNRNYYSVGLNDDLTYHGGIEKVKAQENSRDVWKVYRAVVYKNEGDTMVVDEEKSVLVDSYDTEELADAEITRLRAESRITEYQLVAKVMFQGDDGEVLWYKTNGTNDGNYMTFYQLGSRLEDEFNNLPANPVPLENNTFTKPGRYVVTLYQANNQSAQADGDAAFNAFYKFTFNILSPLPDFTVVTESNVDLNSFTTDGIETYYTNSQHVTVKWTDESSPYMAEIDRDSISVTWVGHSVTPKLAKDIYSISYNELDKTGSFDIDLSVNKFSEIGNQSFWRNGNTLAIAMKYVGYTTWITKNITIDYTAPVENLNTLLDNTANATTSNSRTLYSRLVQQNLMRSLFDATGAELSPSAWTDDTLNENMTNVSYSYSRSSGDYKYFTYPVSADFFSQAYERLESRSHAPTDARDMYLHPLDNASGDFLTGYTQVSKENFSPSNYEIHLRTDYPDLAISGNQYYEVVEDDIAGNMVVYVVYVQGTEDEVAISYSNNQTDDESILTSQITDGFNIYSNTGLKIKSLNYKNDAWGIYKFVINGITTYYLHSPWLDDESKIYRMNGNNLQEVNIDSIFDGVGEGTYKHSLYLSDRETGKNVQVYISIMDQTLQTRRYSDETSATLEILGVPTLEQIRGPIAYVFPVNINIAYWDSVRGWISDILFSDVENGQIQNPTGDIAVWTGYNTSDLTFSHENGNLVVRLNVIRNYSSRFRYQITDNFGHTITVLQMVNEEQFEPVVSQSTIYTFTENDQYMSTTYMSASAITYQYNSLLYKAKIGNVQGTGQMTRVYQDSSRSISRIVLDPMTQTNFDNYVTIELRDATDDTAQPTVVNLRVYNRLAFATDVRDGSLETNDIWFVDKSGNAIQNIEAVPSYSFTFDGKLLTGRATSITTFSNQITIKMDDGQLTGPDYDKYYLKQYSYSAYFYDGSTWMASNSALVEGMQVSGVGTYYVLVKYDDENIFSTMYNLFIISILSSSQSAYYIHVDGLPVQPRYNFNYFEPETGRQISTVYFLNVSILDKDERVSIIPNEDLGTQMTHRQVNMQGNSNGVSVEIWTYSTNRDVSEVNFAVIYIGESNNFLNYLTYDTALGITQDLLQANVTDPANPAAIISEDYNYDSLKINYYNHYGIVENTVNVDVFRLFDGEYVKINVTPLPDANDENHNYIIIEQAGYYRLRFYDSCENPNVERFGQSDFINIVFLDSVPFTVSYNDAEGNTVTTEPINRSVYNGAITLNVTAPLTNPSGYFASGYPTIHVIRNGQEYTGFTRQGNGYTFSENGYYSVTFEAVSTSQANIRQESFVFSIINANESRYSFEYSTYSTYYIKKVLLNGIDVTAKFVDLLDAPKILVDGQEYLTSLQVSYLDEKTGSGRYEVTVETAEDLYAELPSPAFTFAFRINLAKPPITVDLEEGGTTSNAINVTFNAQNMFDIVGDCIVKIPGHSDILVSADTLPSLTQSSYQITTVGTNYVQVCSTSGNVLFSYKITRKEPLNVWAIIAIVLSVVVVGVVVFITIKLRKRLKVK